MAPSDVADGRLTSYNFSRNFINKYFYNGNHEGSRPIAMGPSTYSADQDPYDILRGVNVIVDKVSAQQASYKTALGTATCKES